MRCHPRLGCPIVDEIAATVSAPALAKASKLLKASCAASPRLQRLLCATFGQKIDTFHGQRVSQKYFGQKKGCFYGHRIYQPEFSVEPKYRL